MKTKRGESSKEDKISKLPDDLIHHIFSFIDMKYAVQTCVLSKRWRYVWTSLPILNFNQSTELYSTSQKFLTLVDNVLEHRNNELCNIQRFNVRGVGWLPIPLDRWIHAVVKANVEDIYFYNYVNNHETQIPESLYSCKSLKRLTLEAQVRHMISLPKCVYLPSLIYLKLEYIPFTQEEDVNELISGCPALQHLSLMFRDLTSWYQYCEYDRIRLYIEVKIHSVTLKELKIYKGSGTIMFDLYVPNLVSLPVFESAIVSDIDIEAHKYFGMSEPRRLRL